MKRRASEWFTLAIAMLALLFTLFGGWLRNDKAIAADISDLKAKTSALDAQHADDHEAIQEIRQWMRDFNTKLDQALK